MAIFQHNVYFSNRLIECEYVIIKKTNAIREIICIYEVNWFHEANIKIFVIS